MNDEALLYTKAQVRSNETCTVACPPFHCPDIEFDINYVADVSVYG